MTIDDRRPASPASPAATGDGTERDREPLDRERILRAAMEIADADGVGALSMRKLARHLGYEVMSLYNHIANKDEVLDGIVDLVAGEIVEPEAGVSWKAAVREIAKSANGALVRHRWSAALWSTRWPGPNRWRHMEVLLRLLDEAGLPDHVADLGFHAVTMHIQGFTQQQISYSTSVMDETKMFARFHDEVTPDEYPYMVAHVRYHQEHDAPGDEFGFVLDLILDGLERLADRG